MNKNMYQGMPFPLMALPEIVRAAVSEVQSNCDAPIPIVVAAALAAMSTACQGKANVVRPKSIKEMPISIFSLLLAASGERKSEVMGLFMQPIREFETLQAEAAKKQLLQYQADLIAWKIEKKVITSRMTALTRGGLQ